MDPILSQMCRAHNSTPHFLKIYLNIILPSRPMSCKWFYSFRVFDQNFYAFIISSMRATCPVHLILLYFITILFGEESRDVSVGIALGYGLDDRGSRVRSPAGAGNFSLRHRVQNGSGAHPASYTTGTRGSSLGVKRPRCEADPSPHLVPRPKNEWSCTSTSPPRLHGVVLS
jgi:hypothetical protein